MGKPNSRKRAKSVSNSDRKKRQRRGIPYYDYSLLAVIVLLMCFGLIMLYSTSFFVATRDFEGNDMHYFTKQAGIGAICILGAVGISIMDYHILKHFAVISYVVSLGLMALVQTPLGVVSNGARRWLEVGPIQFQPAEIAKIAVILCMSCYIIKIGPKVGNLREALKLSGIGIIQAGAALVLTDNLSTAIIILGITMGMVFLSYPKTKSFLILMLVGIILVSLLVLFLYVFVDPKENENFRIQRILVWLRPEQYADKEGYQILQALYAIGSGGLFGRGLGNSIQKLGRVPEVQNDMIFSIICEELGIVGGCILVFMFLYLLYRLFFIAQNAPDMLGFLLVSGVFIHMALQILLNIAIVLNLLPNTGVTLPFVSYGGTSILFLMSEMGLALSVSRQIRIVEPEV